MILKTQFLELKHCQKVHAHFLIADSKVINTQFSIVLALGNLKRMTKMISSNSYLGESIKGILKDHSTLQMQEQM